LGTERVSEQMSSPDAEGEFPCPSRLVRPRKRERDNDPSEPMGDGPRVGSSVHTNSARWGASA